MKKKIKIALMAMMAVAVNLTGQTLSEKQMQNARATGYAIVASKNPNVEFSIILIPWDGVNSLEHNANNQINPAWHPQAVIKGNYFNQSFDGTSFTNYSSVLLSQERFDALKHLGTEWWIVCSTLPSFSENVKYKGNVGIGTPNNPTAGLEIFKGSTNDLALLLKSSGPGWGSGLQLHNTGSGNRYGMYSASNGKWHFTHEGKGSRMTIDALGNIGIGTSSPSTKLDVAGEVKTNSGRLVFRDNSLEEWYTNGTARIAVNYLGYQKGQSQFRDFTVYDGKGNGILYVNGEGGNVGIGTQDTKSFKLGVNGKIVATEMKVANYANWADFVFDKSYALPTLSEVENHIKEKGHLKDIPSAKEVNENGFFLGEMDAKLLQKIEELTLYTIKQEKKIKALEKQNSKIEKQEKELEELKTLVNKLLKDKN